MFISHIKMSTFCWPISARRLSHNLDNFVPSALPDVGFAVLLFTWTTMMFCSLPNHPTPLSVVALQMSMRE